MDIAEKVRRTLLKSTDRSKNSKEQLREYTDTKKKLEAIDRSPRANADGKVMRRVGHGKRQTQNLKGFV